MSASNQATTTLTLIEGKNLPIADHTGKPDPYCVAWVQRVQPRGDNTAEKIGQTPICDETPNPRWNHTFQPFAQRPMPRYAVFLYPICR